MTLERQAPRNHALWLGPLVGIFGVLSYFALFARWPATRDFPWVNLILVALAVGLSGLGLARALGRGGLRRALGIGSLTLSSACAALLVFYCFVFSYDLPETDGVLAVGAEVPAIRLVAHDGSEVDLRDPGAERLVLVFYRGFW